MKTSLFVIALLAAMPVAAQYTGPGAQPVATDLQTVLDKPVDDQRVILRGKLIRQVSTDKYIFSDGSREIRVDIDRKLFPARPIAATTQVEIVGEVEKDFLESLEIDVDALRVVE
jgi:uncharacterized protein (TIGR00156 family)